MDIFCFYVFCLSVRFSPFLAVCVYVCVLLFLLYLSLTDSACLTFSCVGWVCYLSSILGRQLGKLVCRSVDNLRSG